MSGAGVEERLQYIVRAGLLAGSDRELAPDAPLGEFGLDSLALVTFLTSVEASFGVALPDDAWIARGPLTLEGVAALVRAAGAEQAATGSVNVAPSAVSSRSERLERALAKHGAPGGALWWLALRLRRLKWFVFDRDRNIVLERRLDEPDLPLPRISPPPGIELRPYEAADDVTGLWPPIEEERARRDLARALARGAIALVAAEGDRIVGLDLLSATGEQDVRLSEREGACYGFRLVVAPAARGRGIGAALLAYSLDVAREQGFRAQLTFVNENNREMLVTATHALGFRPVGRAQRTRIAGRSRWFWDVGGRRGAGPKLLL